jgi:hypothetical protein
MMRVRSRVLGWLCVDSREDSLPMCVGRQRMSGRCVDRACGPTSCDTVASRLPSRWRAGEAQCPWRADVCED